jgi:hypothetical protein
MHTPWIAVALALASVRPALADDNHVTGFITYAKGELTGQVTDEDGHPVAGAKVHLATPSGTEKVVTADRQGKFKTPLPGDDGHTLVYVSGAARISGQATVPSDQGAPGEVVEIHEVIRPAVMPKPLSRVDRILEYTDAAIDRDVWTRAWLLLEITETGTVARLKLINRPGYDLDAIAIREGLKLRFEPARDRAGRPTRTLLLWTFEWPSYWFMQRTHQMPTRLPEFTVDCRGTKPMRATYRDCTPPDLGHAMALPWVENKP